jgi:PKD repeat protein
MDFFMTMKGKNRVSALILAILFITIVLVPIVSAKESTGQIVPTINKDSERVAFVQNLKDKGYSDKEIAEKIIGQLSLTEKIDLNSSRLDKKLIVPERDIQNISNYDLIDVDDTVKEEVPYYWVILIADNTQKAIFISEIENSALPDKNKTKLKNDLSDIWKKYPMDFIKKENVTKIEPVLKNKKIQLSQSEYKTLELFDQIHSFKGNQVIVTPKWVVYPTHYYLVYWASSDSHYPDPTTAAQHAGDPDVGAPWNAPDMYFNPDFQTGVAPTNAQISFWSARNYYQSGDTPSASIDVGRASHYLTDVGNPLHTGRELDQVTDKLLHPNGDDIHSLYENYTSNYWSSDFQSYVIGKQYDYKWNWGGANPSTKEVATYSHAFVDTLYTKIYNNRSGFTSDSWVREITQTCILTSSQYNNGLIDAVMLRQFPNYSRLPTDPDNDKSFEDVGGNGRMDYDDVVNYYQNMDWISGNEPIVLFDYNENGRIDYNDLILLYWEVLDS